jgi:hypothetical protein
LVQKGGKVSIMIDTLIELAERCEFATKPCCSLDYDIARARGYHVPSQITGGVAVIPTGRIHSYTTYVDAAATLVPAGMQWGVEHYPACKHGKGNSAAWVDNPGRRYAAHSPALALCAAALRARHAQGIEAAPAAETVKLGSVHESPVAKPCAQKGSA